MKKIRRKRKIRVFRVVIAFSLFLTILYGLFYFFINNDSGSSSENIDDSIVNNLYKELIISERESDSNIIKDVLTNGMNAIDFKKLLDRKAIYITTKNTYKTMNYDFDKKLSYKDIEEYLYNMSSSDIVILENIGKSVDDRIIYGIEVGKGDKVLFIDGNIHAAEVGGTLFILKLLNDLVINYEDNVPEVKELLNNYKIVAIPSINPDGYEYVNFGIDTIRNKNLWIYKNKDNIDQFNSKFNANGVDLNRNFPTQNGALLFEGEELINSVSLEKTTSIYKYYSGDSLASEPETRAFMYYFIKHYKNIHTYLNIHSQGRVLYAGKPNLTSEFNSLCKKTAQEISNITNYTVYGTDYEEVGEGNDGSVTDFASELAHGFKFSEKTGRLSSDKHIDNSSLLKYNYSVITLETMDRYTTDVKYFKDEWIYRNFKDLFISLLKNDY